MADWLPGTEQERFVTLQRIARGVAERPGVYGVSADAAAEAERMVAELEQAIAEAGNPATRTAITVAAKSERLDAAVKHFRRLASFFRMNPNIGESDLAAIGLPPKAERRRTPPPETVPLLAIRRIVPGGHEIEFVDSAAPDRRAKPEGVSGLELVVAYSPTHAAGDLCADTIVKNGKPHDVLTRTPATVIHPNERVGSVANYVGRWINRRGEAGPWSQPVRMALAMPGEAKLSAAA